MQPQHQAEMLLQAPTRVRPRIGMLASLSISTHTRGQAFGMQLSNPPENVFTVSK